MNKPFSAKMTERDLHRVNENGRPDWENIPQEEWKFWHHIAAKTNGLVTPANLVSILGGVVTVAGLVDIARGHPKQGSLKVIFGAIADIIDGKIARATNTISPTGEIVDASMDKLKAFAALAVLRAIDAMPSSVVIPMATQATVNTLISGAAKRQGTEIHSSEDGKNSMVPIWGAIGGYCVAAALRTIGRNHAAHFVHDLATVSAAAGIGIGAGASADLWHQYQQGKAAVVSTESL